MTNREIARELGGCVTEQRISQIANAGLIKLRKRLLLEVPEIAHLFRT